MLKRSACQFGSANSQPTDQEAEGSNPSGRATTNVCFNRRRKGSRQYREWTRCSHWESVGNHLDGKFGLHLASVAGKKRDYRTVAGRVDGGGVVTEPLPLQNRALPIVGHSWVLTLNGAVGDTRPDPNYDVRLALASST